jgi:phosphosulfolactate synthase (CoM biosynthesis protein A)
VLVADNHLRFAWFPRFAQYTVGFVVVLILSEGVVMLRSDKTRSLERLVTKGLVTKGLVGLKTPSGGEKALRFG